MTLLVVAPPSGGLISLADAKAQCRVEADDDDTLFSALILAASATVEAETQRRFLSQTVAWVLDCWPDRALPIAAGRPDLISVSSVAYVDSAGVQQTLDPSLYWSRPAGETLRVIRRRFAVWPLLGDAAEPVVVSVAITGVLADVPPAARHACRLLVAHLWRNREAVVGVENRDSSTELPLGVESLLTSLRWS